MLRLHDLFLLSNFCELVYIYADFTPSRGTTPKHHFTLPTDGKKKLFDLLREVSSRGEQVGDDQNAASRLTNSQPLRSSEGSPHLSGANSAWSSEATTPAGRDFNNRKERMHCCFPSLRPSRSFNDRRKPKMSPAPTD